MNFYTPTESEEKFLGQEGAIQVSDPADDMALLGKLLEIYDQGQLAAKLNEIGSSHCRETVNRWVKGKASPRLTYREYKHLESLLPTKPSYKPSFTFIDLFAGIGGIRKGFEAVGGECVFTSEWNEYAVRTYKANHYCDPSRHRFNKDIRSVTLSDRPEVSEEDAYTHIDTEIPDHDVLLAGFPCQPFSLAGVSKKNSLGKKHGFECETQGTLFFDVARIIAAKKPAAFLLENVKNLKSHDKGTTFRIICEALDELGYEVSDVNAPKGADPKVIDAKHFVPQHRERIVLVGFRRDLGVHNGFTLKDIHKLIPKERPSFGDILDKDVDSKYILTPKLWDYLYRYAEKHRQKGNGFGFGLTRSDDVARTLSARYHKDGSEILVDRGFVAGLDFHSELNQMNRPRRLTPHECSRLMGFDKPGESKFVIPVSDTQAYRQFGNSVAVPVFEAVAKLMKDRIIKAKERKSDFGLVAGDGM
jgi:DNA (cytosine-5)-methyltransferase 1